MNKRLFQPVIYALFVALLTTGFGWAFNAEIFAHELDHANHFHSSDPVTHHQAHQQGEAYGDDQLDAATHLTLHAAGQYQPFFFISPVIVPASGAIEVLTVFIPATVPESIPDSPLHPPRNILFV